MAKRKAPMVESMGSIGWGVSLSADGLTSKRLGPFSAACASIVSRKFKTRSRIVSLSSCSVRFKVTLCSAKGRAKARPVIMAVGSLAGITISLGRSPVHSRRRGKPVLLGTAKVRRAPSLGTKRARPRRFLSFKLPSAVKRTREGRTRYWPAQRPKRSRSLLKCRE